MTSVAEIRAFVGAPERAAEQPRWPRIAVVALVAAAFGPYVRGGLRTDHIVVYGLAAFALLALLLAWRGRETLVRPAGLAISSWIVIVVVASISTIFPLPAGTPFPRGSLVAGMDNLLMPLAICTCVAWLVSRSPAAELLDVASWWVVALACGNALVAILQAVNSAVVVGLLGAWLPPPSESSAGSVASMAGQLGRYSGIFNQPAEAGLAYAVAALCAIHVARRSVLVQFACLTLITIGGILCVSKVFLFVGAPVAIVLLIRRGVPRLLSLVLLGFAALAALANTALAQWEGLDYLLRFTQSPSSGLIDLLTAGRIGGQNTLGAVTDTILQVAPVGGVGAAGLRTPYDNGWVEALVVAGIVGVLAYTLVLVCLTAAATHAPAQSRMIAMGLCVVVIGGSIGLPVLTANRSGLLTWLVLLLALHRAHPDKTE